MYLKKTKTIVIKIGSSIIIGLITGIVTFYAVYFKTKISLDDALDVFAVHGLGGIVGLICLGIFAKEKWSILQVCTE